MSIAPLFGHGVVRPDLINEQDISWPRSVNYAPVGTDFRFFVDEHANAVDGNATSDGSLALLQMSQRTADLQEPFGQQDNAELGKIYVPHVHSAALRAVLAGFFFALAPKFEFVCHFSLFLFKFLEGTLKLSQFC